MVAPTENTAQDAQPSSPKAADPASSSSQPRFISTNPFRRSSGSFTGNGVLARLTSSSSIRQQTSADAAAGAEPPRERRPSIGRRISSRTFRKSSDGSTGANLAELSKPTGKFKSGIKWESQQTPEPFMEASDSTAAERELASTLEVQAALSSGSTAAAQAHAQSRGIGQPLFQHRSPVSSPSNLPRRPSPKQLPTVSQTISALGSSGIHPEILGSTSPTTMQQEASPPTATADAEATRMPEQEAGMTSGDGATPCMTPPTKSTEASQSEQGALTGDNHMVARAAQLVLEAARQQARAETRKKGKSAPASPKRIGSSLSPVTTNGQDKTTVAESGDQNKAADGELSRSPSQRARSKSDAGGEAQVKRRKSFLRAMSARTRRNKSEANGSEDGSETPTPGATSPTTASGSTSGTATPGRRRRYADTRDLDLLARELAAEAIAEQMPQPPFARGSRSGSSSPHRVKAGPGALNDPRRRSFPSILEDSPLQDDSITPITPVAGAASKGLKPMTPLHSSRPNARVRAAGGRSMVGVGAAKATTESPDPTNGMVPREMFLGLGGSPYPTLPPPSSRSTSMSLDTTDPFGIPLTQESSPFDATMAYANKTNVYHTPNQVAVSRSLSGASTWSASQTSPNNKRRPVLTMTMNDPEAQLQGLTKPPKEGKRLTPFGSRASSRAPSPSPSFTNLKQAAALQKESNEQASPIANDVVSKEAAITSTDDEKIPSVTTDEGSLRPQVASIEVPSRRTSMAPSEVSVRDGLAPSKPSKKNRLSAMFRSNRSKVQVDTVSTLASSTPSPELSVYATPSAETGVPTLSPQSAAVSTDSDADVSPVAFRTVDLPSTKESSGRRSKPTSRPPSRPPSANASRRSSMALDSVERPAAKKRPIRALLRRLSSFSSKTEKEANNAKAKFPDAATMPVVDMEKLKQLSKADDVKVDASTESSVVRTSDTRAERTWENADANVESTLAPAIQGLDLSNASPAPVNEEMAKNGFGTRSAYKLVSSTSNSTELKTVEAVEKRELELGASSTQDEANQEGKELGREDGWDRSRPAQIVRADSQTPSSEDSFFLGSGHSTLSRPGSGALMKHGSESAISEELHTPDPSTAHLPQTKVDELALEGDALSSTVSSVTAAAAKVMANGAGNNGPVVTAVPSDEIQHQVAV